jgi:hypothetical protein
MWQLLLLSVPLAVAREFTVSGMSSGAFMAVQMHFAYSADITAAGVIAGGPFYCVGTEPDPYYYYCSFFADQLEVDDMVEYIEDQADKGNIDPTSNLKDDKVFLFTGTADDIVVLGVGKLNYDIYKLYVDNDNIDTDFTINTKHVWPLVEEGDCLNEGKCGYDTAEKIFTTAYGNLNDKVEMIEDNLETFDQTQYFPSSRSHGLGDLGFIYIPTNCQDNPEDCRIHVHFHGCFSNYDQIGDYWVKNAGLNEWAESNDIVVIYPQTNVESISLLDEKGCWDYWGAFGYDYALKSGAQMKAVYEMAQDIAGEDSDDAQALLLSLLAILFLIF